MQARGAVPIIPHQPRLAVLRDDQHENDMSVIAGRRVKEFHLENDAGQGEVALLQTWSDSHVHLLPSDPDTARWQLITGRRAELYAQKVRTCLIGSKLLWYENPWSASSPCNASLDFNAYKEKEPSQAATASALDLRNQVSRRCGRRDERFRTWDRPRHVCQAVLDKTSVAEEAYCSQ